MDGTKERSAWIKRLSIGICHEKVEKAKDPIYVSASKTFKKVDEFDGLRKHIALCVLELNEKIHDAMDEYKIFPL